MEMEDTKYMSYHRVSHQQTTTPEKSRPRGQSSLIGTQRRGKVRLWQSSAGRWCRKHRATASLRSNRRTTWHCRRYSPSPVLMTACRKLPQSPAAENRYLNFVNW